jgi:hypothetical protein
MAEGWDSVETFLTSKLGIEMFMNEKSEVLVELGDEKWLWNLALLYDIELLK